MSERLTKIVTKTELVPVTSVRVGDLLARHDRHGYCSPAMSFQVLEIVPGADLWSVGLVYENPETGEIVHDGPASWGEMTRRVTGVDVVEVDR